MCQSLQVADIGSCVSSNNRSSHHHFNDDSFFAALPWLSVLLTGPLLYVLPDSHIFCNNLTIQRRCCVKSWYSFEVEKFWALIALALCSLVDVNSCISSNNRSSHHHFNDDSFFAASPWLSVLLPGPLRYALPDSRIFCNNPTLMRALSSSAAALKVDTLLKLKNFERG